MSVFLTAEWRHLVMLNYEIDPAVLRPLVPRGTELDTWNGRSYISMVGFLFLKTRLFGLTVPCHANFEEVNLRFYVRRRGPDGWRRGVVFAKELVPRRAIAAVARLKYNENYHALPMRHRMKPAFMPRTIEQHTPEHLTYEWKYRGRWHSLTAESREPLSTSAETSEACFITEHYWGYVTQRNGDTVEYQVEHPRWQIRPANHCQLNCNVAALYGPEFEEPLRQTPTSAFIADGSPITVHKGQRIA